MKGRKPQDPETKKRTGQDMRLKREGKRRNCKDVKRASVVNACLLQFKNWFFSCSLLISFVVSLLPCVLFRFHFVSLNRTHEIIHVIFHMFTCAFMFKYG